VKPAILVRLACAFALMSLVAPPASAQLQDERAVKAAFVFNLTKYVEWPHPSDELVIGFIGDSSMGEVLRKTLAGKTSESRPIRVLLSPSDDELERCNIFYIAQSSPAKIRSALDKVRNKSILTVGDAEPFAREGGMVGLVRAGEQVQIQVNLEVTRESQLKISFRLLNLSVIVRSTPGARDRHAID
jgi:hypothetical protein